jgi:SAM-dependent methyltransferase
MTHTQPSWQWYDENADLYQDMDPATLEFGRQLLDYADPAPGSRLLDVGAGRGAVAGQAIARGCRVTAVDAAPGMVARLRADFPTMTVARMDAHHFDFPDSSFDVVTAGFVLDLLSDRDATLAEARRVLRSGGVFALSLPGPLPQRERWQWLVELTQDYYGTAVQAESPASAELEVAESLTAAGFVSVSRKDFQLPVPISGPAELWETFSSRLPSAVSAGWVDRLPIEAAAEFRHRFLAGAERMHATGGIAMDRYIVLHRATAP